MLALTWFLGLHPLNWIGISTAQSVTLVILIWIIVSVYSSLFTCIFGIIASNILNLSQNLWIKSLLVAFSWSISVNLLMSFGNYAFPWAMIEYSQYRNMPVLQFAQYIGGIGIGFIILFANSCITLIIKDFLSRKANIRQSIMRFSLIMSGLLFIYLSGISLLSFQNKPTNLVTATVIQSSLSIEHDKLKLVSEESLKRYFLKEIKKAPPGIVVIPEGGIYDYLRFYDHQLFNKFKEISRKENKTLIIGTLDIIKDENKLFPTNSVIVFDKNIVDVSNNIYNKQNLVPFGEYLPFRNLIPKYFDKIVNNIIEFDYYKGEEIKVISTSIGILPHQFATK
jgi:apolipoprotein N-acyltransferase